ncbi:MULTISPECIES: PIG-L family deacetylase [unclassified Mycobacterium]|uniref:PIG-L deacetylase family protein n=1 Tax=unclassified Mycobacterium TaxID=2642494 RepID=UPI0009927CAD|nr:MULTISPECIES: PIG-L family deacetylase [unclassified Mycobacterium]
MSAANAGNCGRLAERPISAGGTSLEEWLAWPREFPRLDLDECPALVLVAPHPDDETLGFGSAASLLRARGVDVVVVSVSDGGGAYPGLSSRERRWLERDRRAELLCATDILGLDPPVRLGLADGALAECEEEMSGRLVEILVAARPGVWCAATWRGDGHPDHEAVGRAAAAAASRTGAVLLEYPVWMWHWAVPDDNEVPWHQLCTVPRDHTSFGLKQQATNAFRTQLCPRKPDEEAILPPHVVNRLLVLGEVVFR